MAGSVNKNHRTKHVPREHSAAGPGRKQLCYRMSRQACCSVITEQDGHVNWNQRMALLMASSEHLGELWLIPPTLKLNLKWGRRKLVCAAVLHTHTHSEDSCIRGWCFFQHKLSDVVKLIDASPHNACTHIHTIPKTLQRREMSG